jgi:hypothetical protein
MSVLKTLDIFFSKKKLWLQNLKKMHKNLPEFYVDEGVNGMHRLRIEQVEESPSSVRSSIVFKGQRFDTISHTNDIAKKRLFELMLRSMGHREVKERNFARGAIVDGHTRRILIYKL